MKTEARPAMMSNTQQIADFSSNSLKIRDSNIANTLSSLSAWKAFQSGMLILQRYANRSAVDINTIAKSNLQLLHRSLSYDMQYNRKIENIRCESESTRRPAMRRLYADQGLTADLLSLQDGAAIDLIASPQRYTMYLLASGHARLGINKEGETSGPLQQRWWNRICSNRNKNYLRDGSVIICANQQANNRLIALGKNCLILRVHTPTMAETYKVAS